MATVTRFITYQIPDNSDYNQLLIFDSTTETGTYSLLDTLNYSYPNRATEYTAINTEKWYKIRFYDSANGEYSPYSDAFFGGEADQNEPFAAITSTFDGVGFATASGFYQTTGLNNVQVDINDVKDALKTAKGYIDLITDDTSPYKYSRDHGTDVTRRKYNAQLELMRKAEIYFAAALVYQDMADDRVMMGLSGSISTVTVPSDLTADAISPSGFLTVSGNAQSFSVGQTSITEPQNSDQIDVARFNVDKQLMIARYNNEKNLAFATYLDDRQTNRYQNEGNFFAATSQRYAIRADALMELFKPSSISMRYGLRLKDHKFIDPGDIYTFSYTNLSTESAFVTNVADLTGLGSSFSGGYFLLNASGMAANTVNGVTGVAVYPLESLTTLVDARLVVNGVTYWLDDWTDHTATLTAGKAGSTGTSGGFSLDYNTGVSSVEIQWNFQASRGGFDITNTDDITFTYWTI